MTGHVRQFRWKRVNVTPLTRIRRITGQYGSVWTLRDTHGGHVSVPEISARATPLGIAVLAAVTNGDGNVGRWARGHLDRWKRPPFRRHRVVVLPAPGLARTAELRRKLEVERGRQS